MPGIKRLREKSVEQISVLPVIPSPFAPSPSRLTRNVTDYDDIARRKYKKDLDLLKPDLAAYNKQRAAANADNTSLALLASSSSSTALVNSAAEDLYRDANSFIYADHKPSEDAIDRVIGKINIESVLHSLYAPLYRTDVVA